MANEQVTHTQAVFEVFQKIEYYRLHRDIQGRRGFIQNQQLGFQGDGPGDANAGLLATGQLMGKAIQQVHR